MSGFSLKKLEIFNWGTFGGEVETFLLGDDITVVSGDNGSGKSTLVDALVSLLVPNQMRKYNLSATEGNQKKARNEMSYVRGAYKNKETESGVEVAFLRDKEYSVILGYFRDEDTKKELTLMSFYRVTTSETLDRFYVVSEQELFIKSDVIEVLNREASASKLKAGLKVRRDTKVYDLFSEYKEDFSKKFGLRANAVELFNKVVSLKEIKDLNSFFRENMLDENPEIKRELAELEKNYVSVKEIYDTIILSQKKLETLDPFMINKQELEKNKKLLESLSYYEDHLPYYHDHFDRLATLESLKRHEQEHKETMQAKSKISQDLVQLRTDERQLQNQKENSKSAMRIKELEHQYELKQHKHFESKKSSSQYQGYLTVLQIPFDGTGEGFKANLELIDQKHTLFTEKKEKNVRMIFDNQTKINDLTQTQTDVSNDLAYYQSRKNLLPQSIAEIRKMIALSTGISEQKMPFVCELIKVKDEEKDWEMAIEKLLHSFGQEMLVPERYLKQVTEFVDSHHLKGKLIYNAIPENIDEYEGEITEGMLWGKLEVKESSDATTWIAQSIERRFDYVCINDAKDVKYYEFPKVLTLSGLIKNKKSYLKDDRPFSPKNYILGWENTKKIALLTQELQQITKEMNQNQTQLQKLQKDQKDYETILRTCEELGKFESFLQIDYLSIETEMLKIDQEKKLLLANDTNLKRIEQQLTALVEEIIKTSQKENDLVKQLGVLEHALAKEQQKIATLDLRLASIDLPKILQAFSESRYAFREVTTQNLSEQRKTVGDRLKRKKEEIATQNETLIKSLNGSAQAYREHRMTDTEKQEAPTSNASQEFWTYLETQYHTIKDENLVKYQQKFEKEFRDTLRLRFQEFYESLENEEHEIERKIRLINATLKEIYYSKHTYIEIAWKKNTNSNDGIESFKKEFRNKILNKTELDTPDKIKAFEDLKDFMEGFLDPNKSQWKNAVIDVRNWFLFRMKENDFTTGDLKEIYESSSGKSGGQTIKLAYTVLAASLLYQYGAKEQNQISFYTESEKSFRLVVIDEVFAKLDMENSQYVLRLFKKLGFQMFIITPTNTINVLEEFVQTIYFITNQTGAKSYKNKLSIATRELIPEEIPQKPLSPIERDYFAKNTLKPDDLEDLKMSLEFEE